MGYITVIDTGYIKPTNNGTQASSLNMANGGSAISFKVAEFSPSLKRNISDTPEIGLNTPSEINLGSLENMKFTLRCVLNKDISSDVNKIQHLIKLVSTDGYKLLFYAYDTTNAYFEKNNGILIYQLAQNSLLGHTLTNAEKTKWGLSYNYSHLHVIFTEIQPRDMPNNLIQYTLTGVVLKVETSVLV